MEPYARACVAEAQRAVEVEGLPEATSVFFGGGTPSRLAPELLTSILDALPRKPDAEVTVECNPEDASRERFDVWRAAGVNRVSFGAQSMVPEVLVGLGRRHVPGSVESAVSLARSAGFSSLSVDLIIGGAGETDADWLRSLNAVLELDSPPDHLSCYALTVEAGTPLANDTSRHPDDDAQATRYEMADAVLSGAGYHWYEVSNWARPGHQCRHNLLYWCQGEYRGIGCAAHSHRRGERWWNVRTPERYISAVGSGQSPEAGREALDKDGRELEALTLAIRTSAGVPAGALGDDPELDGLVEMSGDRAVLTLRGRLLANEVAIRLRPTGRQVGTGILRPWPPRRPTEPT
jgi:oxygen-independent coproporphyrinogen-3 oxidase